MKKLLATSGYRAWLLAFAVLFVGAPVQAQAPDQGTVRERVNAAVQTNPDLHGTWIKVGPADDGKGLKFTVTLDQNRSRAASQRAEVDRLLRSLMAGQEYEVVEGPRLPVSQLLADLQERIEGNTDLGGVLIRDAYLAKEKDQAGDTPTRLMLLGRISQAGPGQRDKIFTLSEKLMAEDPVWAKAKITAQARELQVVLPSEVAAEQIFVNGLRAFARGDYAEAEQAFSEAILDAPDRVDYHYWRIIAEIKQGKTEQAYGHVRPWVQLRRENRVPLPWPRVAQSLERIQGPVRQQLSGLELRAFREGP